MTSVIQHNTWLLKLKGNRCVEKNLTSIKQHPVMKIRQFLSHFISLFFSAKLITIIIFKICHTHYVGITITTQILAYNTLGFLNVENDSLYNSNIYVLFICKKSKQKSNLQWLKTLSNCLNDNLKNTRINSLQMYV